MKMLSMLAVVMSLTVSLHVSSCHAADWEKYDEPVPTKILIRVLSHGAKAMSPSTGAVIKVRDAVTGEELDKGVVQGSTGDTTALMRTGYPRILGATGLSKGDRGMLLKDLKADVKMKEKGWREPDPYYDLRDERSTDELEPYVYESTEDAASFISVINISRPTQVYVEAYGPIIPPQSTGMAVASTWVFPGEDIMGQGVVLEVRGIIVDALASLKEGEVNVEASAEGIRVPFYMRMMCGCPIAPDGKFGVAWEAEWFRITTQAYYKGKLYHEDVTTADKLFLNVSSFETFVPLPPGLPDGKFENERVKIRIMAAQPSQDNFGIDEFFINLKR